MAKAKSRTEVKRSSGFKLTDTHLAFILGAFAFILYAQSINYTFALDDVAVVKGNKFVHKGFGGIGDILHTFYWAGFWETNAGLFRPVSLILFAIEWAFAPDKPAFFHFMNVLLYAVSAFLLYRTLRELFRDHSPVLAFGAALLWIVLPAHTEVVANVKSADEILSVIFFLMMMRRLLWWSESKRMKDLTLSACWLFLALLSKEGALLFLPMAFIALHLFRKESLKSMLRPGVALAIITGLWYFWHWWVIAHAPTEMIKYDRGDNTLTIAPYLVSRFATAMNMQAKYFLKLFLGFPLSYDYSYNENPIVGLGDPAALLAIALCLALIFIAFRTFRKQPVLSFGILFYFVVFSLTSNVIVLVGATMADRFLFAPSIGSCIAITWALMKLTKTERSNAYFSGASLIVIAVSFIYSIRSYSRTQDWKDEPTLYAADVNNAPGSGRVKKNYGVVLMNSAFQIEDRTRPDRRQMLDMAYQLIVEDAQLDTSDFQARLCLGQIEYNRGNYQASAAWSKSNIDYYRARGYQPGDLSVFTNLGDAYIMYHRFDSAYLAFKGGFDANPKNDYCRMRMGDARLAGGDTTSAIQHFEEVVKLNPKNLEAWGKLANVCGMFRQYDRSTEAFLQILKLKPDDPAPLKMVATNYKMKGDSAKMKEYFDLYVSKGGR